MSKYKTGDKVVLEIIQDDSYGDYKVGNETHSWWNSHELLDNGSVPLSKYIKSMEEKLHNQRVEINRLIEENKELKINANWRDNCAKVDSIDKARAAGNEEAWKLAVNISLAEMFGGYKVSELKEIFGSICMQDIFNLTYTEAAAKVAEWEKAKEEIHVGDIVRIHEGNDNDLCIICSSSDGYYNAVDEYGAVYPTLYKKMISKTGRHIDVNAWLKQIGGEQE